MEDEKEQYAEIMDELRIQNSYLRSIVNMKIELQELKKRVEELENKIDSNSNDITLDS